ncbi:hypothetical protein LCGC14_2712950, partial [marine sediment metagenome]
MGGRQSVPFPLAAYYRHLMKAVPTQVVADVAFAAVLVGP